MNTSIVLTIIAEDHPGIVKIVSEVLYKHGGDWTESSMATLAGQFAGILLASVKTENTEECLRELQGLESQGLRVIAQVGNGSPLTGKKQDYVLDLVGNDRKGIVHDITTVLAGFGVNVHHLETVVESMPMGGGEVFKAKARLVVPESADIEALRSGLEAIANELMVRITLKR